MSSNCSAIAACASAMRQFLLGFGGILVRRSGHDWSYCEVMFRRGRRGLPFQARRLPWIGWSLFSMLERPNEINERQDIAGSQDGGPGARHDIVNLELRGIRVIT